MVWLKTHFPLFFSPRFWGIVATATIVWFRSEGWIDELTATWLATIFAGATGVNILDKFAKKIKGQ